MPMPTALRDMLKTVYDAAEASPEKQSVTRISVLGGVYKVLINLQRFPEEVIVIIRKRG